MAQSVERWRVQLGKQSSAPIGPVSGEFYPHVEPIEVSDRGGGKADVKVHLFVKSLDGVVLSDSELWHSFTTVDGVIKRMDIKESKTSGTAPAFSKH